MSSYTQKKNSFEGQWETTLRLVGVGVVPYSPPPLKIVPASAPCILRSCQINQTGKCMYRTPVDVGKARVYGDVTYWAHHASHPKWTLPRGVGTGKALLIANYGGL